MFPHCLPSDNPQQAESSSGVGPGGNRNCIRGGAGGGNEERESENGYCALFSVSSPCVIDVALIKIPCDQPDREKRTAGETVDTITKQLRLACLGVAQRVSDLQTETGIKDKTAQTWIDQALERSSNLIARRVTDSTTRDPRLGSRSYSTEQKQEIRDLLKSQIQEETYDWLLTQPEGKWDELPISKTAKFFFLHFFGPFTCLSAYISAYLEVASLCPFKRRNLHREICHIWVVGKIS
jgi:hypothetical protein